MTDLQFAEFCAEQPGLFFEMTAGGEIIAAPPSTSLTGMRRSQISFQLETWARRNDTGFVTAATGGFVLPNGARRSADASWTLKTRVLALPAESLHGYWHLAPDFAIELRSPSDSLPALRAKMQEWIDNGTRLAWLIDPERRAVEVYRRGSEPEPELDGFTLQLARVWDPLQ